MSASPRGVLVVDFGAQYAQLIARRVREANVWSEIAPPEEALARARGMNLGGIILSGGPASVYDADAPALPAELLELGVPVLGICYGLQAMVQALGGAVEATDRREFGRTSVQIAHPEGLFDGVDGRTVVWMSHGDKVTRLPAGFQVYASSDDCEFAAVGAPERGFCGVHDPRPRDHRELRLARLRHLRRLDAGLDRRARGRQDPRAGRRAGRDRPGIVGRGRQLGRRRDRPPGDRRSAALHLRGQRPLAEGGAGDRRSLGPRGAR